MSGAAIVLRLGRYALFGEIASGGMASIHYGRLAGTGGFHKTIAIKRLLPHFARDPDFRSMIQEEARLCSRIRHPNVVAPLDVLSTEDEVLLAMEYVHGEALSTLLRTARQTGRFVPLPVAATILSGMLHGLHAAHEAADEYGRPLGIVHRDVSPHNVIVGVDGVARVIDFGIAKATTSREQTQVGMVKGKLPYIAPEIFEGRGVTRAADVYAAAVVMWETFTGRRLFDAETDQELIALVLRAPVDPPSEWIDGLAATIDRLVLAGLQRERGARPATCKEMALALEQGMALAPPSVVGSWVEELAREPLAKRAALLAAVERVVVTVDEPAPPASRAPSSIAPSSLAPGSSALRPPAAGELRKPEIEIPNVAWLPTAGPYTAVETTRPRRISGTVFAASLILIALALLLLVLPGYVKRTYLRDARRGGVTLEIGETQLSWRRVRLTGVRFTLPDVPQVSGRAAAVDVQLKELTPDSVRVRGLELTILGPIADRIDDLKKLRAKALDSKASPDDHRDVSLFIEPARIVWTDALGAGTKVVFENVTVEAKVDARSPFVGAPVEAIAPLVRVEAAGSVAGPWRLDVSHGGLSMKARLRFDPTGALDARASVALSDDGSWLVDWHIPRARARDLGAPRLPADAAVEGRGQLVLRERGESAGQGTLSVDTARLELAFAGASPESVSISGALLGPADRVPLFGTVVSTGQGARVDMTAECDSKRGDPPLFALGLDTRDAARGKLATPTGPVRCAKK